MDEPIDLFASVYLIALHNNLYPTLDSKHRAMARWYSSTFSVSIKEALNMPLEELLLHKYEFDLQDLNEKQTRKIFNKIFGIKKEEVSKKEIKEREDLDWSLQQLNIALKQRELAEAERVMIEKGLVSKKPEISKDTEMPPDLVKKF